MDHTATAFEQELQDIAVKIGRMGERAGGELDDALDAILRCDASLAADVIASDKLLDGEEAEVERKAIRVIALRQPVADDLRRLISAMKISANLERCGDLAKNIAKRSRVMAPDVCARFPLDGIERLGRLVGSRLGQVVEAYVARDLEAAVQVWSRDAEIDTAHEVLARELLGAMGLKGADMEAGMHLLFVAKNLERIGDHATNIAELIHYELTGTDIEGARPKHDPLNDPA
jgi:phosphate transport system protein